MRHFFPSHEASSFGGADYSAERNRTAVPLDPGLELTPRMVILRPGSKVNYCGHTRQSPYLRSKKKYFSVRPRHYHYCGLHKRVTRPITPLLLPTVDYIQGKHAFSVLGRHRRVTRPTTTQPMEMLELAFYHSNSSSQCSQAQLFPLDVFPPGYVNLEFFISQ